FMLAKAVNGHQDWRIIYSDSDKLTGPDHERCQPCFKPDWDVDLFYAQNYTEHLCAFDVKLLKQVGGFDERFAAVASFELTLRCLAQLHSDESSSKTTATTAVRTTRIGHIPQVLYHARALREPDTRTQRQAALTAHFARCGTAALVTVAEQGLRVQYTLPEILPMVSLIIPTKNNARLLRQCLDSLLHKTTYANYEVLVVDNGSDAAETLDYLQSLASEPRIRVIRDNYAFNYSALNNAAVLQARSDIVGLVNDDIEIKTADWLSEMVSQVLRPGVGAVGARLWYPDLTLQHAGMVLVGGIARHVHKHLPQGETGFCNRAMLVQSFTAVTGACLLVKKALYAQVGGLNERELAIGFNDVDFCLRLVEAGYRNVWTPYAELFHHESATRGQDDSPDKQRRAEKELRYMRQRWGDRLLVDPAYNPNLTDGHDDFSMAWPPRDGLSTH
ncbi:MAG: glycosyltransferase family 2 protein, partial [Burkholderiaceae bacterium]